MDALAASYFVTAIDFPGHGQSKVAQNYSFELLRDGVLEAVARLRPRVCADSPAVLLGHSLGGAVALICAMDSPALFSHVVVEDAALPSEVAVPLRGRPPGELSCDWAAIEQLVSALHDPDRRRWPGLADLPMPTLVLAGGAVSTVPQDLVQETASLIPRGHCVSFDVGHHIHRTAPADFVDVVLGWLRDTPSQPQTPDG